MATSLKILLKFCASTLEYAGYTNSYNCWRFMPCAADMKLNGLQVDNSSTAYATTVLGLLAMFFWMSTFVFANAGLIVELFTFTMIRTGKQVIP